MKRDDKLFDRQISTFEFSLKKDDRWPQRFHKNHINYLFVNSGRILLLMNGKPHILDAFSSPFEIGIFQNYTITAIIDSEIYLVRRGKQIEGDTYLL